MSERAYYCPACKKVVFRDRNKQRFKSRCLLTGRDVRMQRVKPKKKKR